MRKTGEPAQAERGFALVISYLVLSAFLVYSQIMTMRTITERAAQNQYLAEAQALDLAQAAIEQLRDEFNDVLGSTIYQLVFFGDAIQALGWLDTVLLDPDDEDNENSLYRRLPSGGTAAQPRCLVAGDLPTIPAGVGCSSGDAPRAWISRVCARPIDDPDDNCIPDNVLDPRLVTIEAEAQVGSVTKHIRAVYQIELSLSDIFNNAYSVNNQGWFQLGNPYTYTRIHGDVRANGNLVFDIDATPGEVAIQGNLYAAENRSGDITPEADGLILTADIPSGAPDDTAPIQWDLLRYFRNKPDPARPLGDLVFDGQPEIVGGTPTLSTGWDGSQTPYPGSEIETIPYLGDLSIYRTMAQELNGSLTIDGTPIITDGVYLGEDGEAGTSDDTAPLVLIGTTPGHPIEIHGPVVVPGDVIIRGHVTGQGVIYTGRNLHVIGAVKYKHRPSWPSLQRNRTTGQLRKYAPCGNEPNGTFGFVCRDGTYVPDGGGGC